MLRRSSMSRAGLWILAIAAVHLATAPLWHSDGLEAILAQGVVDGVESGSGDVEERAAAYWYAASGLLLIPLGFLCWRLELSGIPLPSAFGWMLLAFGIGCAVVVPSGGFWLFVVPAALAIRSIGRPVTEEAAREAGARPGDGRERPPQR